MDFTVLMKDTCEDTSTCLDVWEGDESYLFKPSSAGTYYLIADLPFDIDGDFSISIEVQ
jgi:hypothetical protein